MHSEKIKIYYIGSFGKHCSDKYRVKGLNECRNIDLIGYGDFRAIWKVCNNNENDFSNIIIESIKDSKVVLVNKGEIFTDKIYENIRKARPDIKIFYWYGDMRDKYENFVHIHARNADAVFVNNNDVRNHREFFNMGAKRVFYSHTATDLDTFDKMNTKVDTDIAFFGSNYKDKFRGSLERTEIIRALFDSKFKVRIYGNNWGERGKKIVYGNDFAREASRAKILLSISNYNDINYYASNRLWNSMACGFTISDNFKGVREIFKESELLVYNDSENLFKILNELLLDTNSNTRNVLYSRGRAELINHTYKARSDEMYTNMMRVLNDS